ncbi:hypothetical protein [Thermosulfurimonas dismutans]|uniref:CD-NTase-associated protein 12/Pycsar effector protein TIR domain-containing protein n=1 Tax=Thermosulfurimonas dismutans TaxID=999894 RepID=A0A179D288_9BACT|nr:hypothetical protein [Thermosulfurimonas dismutans]OAQ20170.1 hypothetical protein TDIS_1672 [Thermosulfurimonas dismutans]
MPIQNLNRFLRQYFVESLPDIPQVFIDAIDKLRTSELLKNAGQIQVNIIFDDIQVTGTIDQVRNDINQIPEECEFHSFNASIVINENPRKTINMSYTAQNRIFTFQTQNFTREQSRQLFDLIKDKFPKSHREVTGEPKAEEQVVPVKENFLPGPFAPTPIPDEVSARNVFVIMSFQPEFRDAYYVAIEPTLTKLGFKPVRVDQIQHNRTVTAEILTQIESAAFVVADLTGERPNVYYEVGWAHRANKEVVLLARKGTAVHFDVAAINRIEYNDYTELCESLEKRVRAIAKKLGLNIEENTT